jgi:hypothetical protein
MPQYLLKVSPAYAKSHFGVVIGGAGVVSEPPTLMPSARVKTQIQELTENPDQVVIEPSPDPGILVDLGTPPDDEPRQLPEGVEVVHTGGGPLPLRPPILDERGNVVG